MKMLQTMSLAGSVVVIFYVVIKLCGRKAFTYSFYKKMLMLAMVFFLFPFQEFVYPYADLLSTIFPLKEWGLEKFLPYMEWGKPIENYVEYTEGGQFRINHIGFYIFTLVCLFFMLALMAGYIYKSRKIRKKVSQGTEQVKWERINQQYNELKKSMKIKENIELKVSENINSPITMGVMKPVIFLPKHMYEEKEMSFMLTHELNHIKRKDMFLTIVCYVILMLNFYNPVAYYLIYEWKRVVELACDEKVMECMTEEERKKYGLLLVDMAEKEMFVYPTYSLGFGFAREKLIKERVKNVMKKRKMSGIKRVVAGGLMMGVTFASSLTIFAYEPDVTWEVEELGDSETEIVFLTEEMFEKELNTVEIEGNEIIYESKGYEQEIIYVDENGQVVVEKYQTPMAGTKAICQHTYANGIQTIHQKKASGGCTTTYYNVVVCTNCGYVKSKSMCGKLEKPTCNH